MTEKIHNLSLFTTGFLQVFFVAMNTVFLSRQNYLGVLFASFAISFIWSLNVKRVAFGSTRERVVYAAGATAGSLAGLFISSLFE